MNDSEQAEAVVNGLAENGQFICDCGQVHAVAGPSQDPLLLTEEVAFPCECGLECRGSRRYDKTHKRAYWVWYCDRS